MDNKPAAPQSREEVEKVIGAGRRSRFGVTGWLIVFAIIATVGGFAYQRISAVRESANIQYTTDPARMSDISVIVTATGSVEPTNKVDVSSELSGIIRTVNVDYNSKVKKGDVLARLDTDTIEAQMESSRAKVTAAEAGVGEAEATLEDSKSQLDRKKALAKTNVVSSQDLETATAAYHKAEAALASARAAVVAAKADLNIIETNLQKACICSPINGVVLSRNVDPGQVVAASLQAPVLFTIAEDLSKMEVQVDIDEADVGKVKEGQEATFSVDAYPGEDFKAQIKQVRYGSEVVQGVVTYKAVLSADNSKMLLRPGMTATAEIVVQRENNVLTVSNEALRFSPPVTEPVAKQSFLQKLLPGFPRFRQPSAPVVTGDARNIWVLRNGEAKELKVTIGATDGKRTAIRAGDLKSGDEVIVDAKTTKR